MLYVFITIFLFLLSYQQSGKIRSREQIYNATLVGLFLFSAFRYQVGCDWTGYLNQFEQASTDWSYILSSSAPIWWFFLGWVKELGLIYPIMNVISSFIFFAGIHVLAKRQPDPLGFLVLLFPILIINMPMTAMRQGAAIGLISIAITKFLDQKTIPYAFWVILATGFHNSAAVFFLLIPLATGRYTRNRLIMAALLAIPGIIILAGGEGVEMATSRYVDRDVQSNGAIYRIGLLSITSFYFFFFVRKKWKRLFPEDFSIVSIGAMGMALAFALIPVSTVIGDRFGYYLVPIQTMIFARLPFLPFRSIRSLHIVSPYIGLIVVFSVWSLLSRHFQLCYVPYNTWLFGIPENTMYSTCCM